MLRRYLNDLPEPVVPLGLYEKFRDPLRGATRQAVGDAEGPQFVDNFDIQTAIARYQQLIKELPPLNRQLLLYLLDLLAVFAAKADQNRMNSQNLAAIFQPGILSHPSHSMAPEEYRLNQCVLIFLIENQDHFLIGMQGTAADAKTVEAVQQGTPVLNEPSTPVSAQKAGVTRSSSNASAGATSVAMEGQVRRNKSVSSRRSRHSNGARSPSSPVAATTPTSGLSRSNTLPPRRSPAMQSGRFTSPRRDLGASPVAPLTPITPSITPSISAVQRPEVVEEVATRQEESAHGRTPRASVATVDRGLLKNQERLLEPPTDTAATSRERRRPSLFQRSPSTDQEGRQPKKLRKKRIPGSANASAQSSTASLPHSTAVSPGVEVPNPMDPAVGQPIPEEVSSAEKKQLGTTSEPTHRASQGPSGNTLHHERAEKILRAKQSPQTSLHSSFNEASDIDQLDEAIGAAPGVEGAEKENKKRWRLSRRKEDLTPIFNTAMPTIPPSPRNMIGSNAHAEASSSSIGSAGAHKAPRQSFSVGEPFHSDATLGESSNRDVSSSGSGREDVRGLTGWIKNKVRGDKKDRDTNQGRSKSPPRERPGALGSVLHGKSVDVKYSTPEEGRAQGQAEGQAMTNPQQ